jgi:hypothetical protein
LFWSWTFIFAVDVNVTVAFGMQRDFRPFPISATCGTIFLRLIAEVVCPFFGIWNFKPFPEPILRVRNDIELVHGALARGTWIFEQTYSS